MTTFFKYSDIACEITAQDQAANWAKFLINQITNKWTSKASKEQNLNNAIFAQAAILQKEYNCSAFFINLTLSRTNSSVLEQWEEMKKKIPILLQNIKKSFIVTGGVVSMEMQKNTSKTNKRGINSKAGSPQLLFMLWITHTIFYPELEQQLRLLFLEENFKVKLKAISELTNVKKHLLYTIKEAADPDLREFCRHVLRWPAITLIWNCHSECQHVFYQIQKTLNSTKKKYTSFLLNDLYTDPIPTTKWLEEPDLILNQIFNKWFEKKKWALHVDTIYRLQPNTKFTWEKHETFDTWVTQKADSPNLQQLKGIIYLYQFPLGEEQTKIKKIFPHLIIEPGFLEFKEALYHFETGQLKIEQLSHFTSCIDSFPGTFNELKPPYKILGLLYFVISKQLKEQTPQYINSILWKNLKLLGGLFHFHPGYEDLTDFSQSTAKADIDKNNAVYCSIIKNVDHMRDTTIRRLDLFEGVQVINFNKRIVLILKNNRWQKSFCKGNKKALSNIQYEDDNKYIFIEASIAFSILINSIYLNECKKPKIQIPNKWSQKSSYKPEYSDKECNELKIYEKNSFTNQIMTMNNKAIERRLLLRGLKCFQYVMKKLENVE